MSRPNSHLSARTLRDGKQLIHRQIASLLERGIKVEADILEECDDPQQLDAVEQYYIREYRQQEASAWGNVLINTSVPTNAGRKHTAATKAKIAAKNRERVITPATRLKLRLKQIGKKLTDVQKAAISLHSPRRREVVCIETGEAFNSIRQTAKALKCDHRGIARCCHGEYKSYLGKTFKFKDSP